MANEGMDTKIVSLQLDNAQYESAARQTIKTNYELDHSLSDMGKDGGKHLRELEKEITASESSLKSLIGQFSVFETIAAGALMKVGSSITSYLGRMLKGFTIKPAIQGLDEYETKLKSIQTFKTNTGEQIGKINEALNELNDYADKTIYNFAEMTAAASKFTTSGFTTKQAATMAKGIANVAAGAGAANAEMQRVLYQTSQVSGAMRLQDWMSWERAGMASMMVKQAFVDTAKALGKAAPAVADFRSSLSDNWLTNDVMIKTMERLTDTSTDVGMALTMAATEVRTFKQLIDVTGESIGSGWARVWEAFLGDFDEARSLFTSINVATSKFIDNMFEAIEVQLKFWKGNQGREKLIAGLANVFKILAEVIKPVQFALRTMFPNTFGQNLLNATNGFERLTQKVLTFMQTSKGFQTFAGILSIVTMVASGLVKIFFRLVGSAFKLAGIIGGILLKGVFALFSAFGAFAQWLGRFPFVQDLIKIFFRLGEILSNLYKIVKMGVTNAFVWLNKNLGKTGTAVSGFLEKLNKTSPAFAFLAKAATSIGNVLRTISGGALAGLSKASSYLSAMVSNKNTKFANIASGAYQKVSLWASKFYKVLKDLGITDAVARAFKAIGAALMNLPELFTKAYTAVKDFFINLKEHGGAGIGDMFGFLGESAVKAVDFVVSIFSGLKNKIMQALTKDKIDIKQVILAPMAAGNVVKSTFATLNSGVEKEGFKFSSILGVFKRGFDILKQMGSGVFSFIFENLNKISGLLAAIAAFKVSNMVSKLGNMFTNIGDGIASFGKSILRMANSRILSELKGLAVALIAFVGAVGLLSFIPWDKLKYGLLAAGGAMAVFALGISVIAMASGDLGSMSKLTGPLLGMAATLLVLAIAVKAIAKTKPERMADVLKVLGVALGGLAAIALLSARDASNAANGMNAVTGSILGLALGVLAMSFIPIDKLVRGVLALAAVLGSLAIAVGLINIVSIPLANKTLPDISANIASLGKVILDLTAQIAVLAMVPMDKFWKVIGGVSILIGALAVLVASLSLPLLAGKGGDSAVLSLRSLRSVIVAMSGLLLVVALAVNSGVNVDDAIKLFGIVSAIATGILAVAAGLAWVSKGQMFKLNVAIGTITGTVLLLVLAVKRIEKAKISDKGIQTLIKVSLVIDGLLVAMGVFMGLAKKRKEAIPKSPKDLKNLADVGKLLLGIGAVVGVIAGAIYILQDISVGDLVKGGVTLLAMSAALGGIVIGLAAVNALMRKSKRFKIPKAGGSPLGDVGRTLMSVAASVGIIAIAIKVIGNLNPDELKQTAIVVGGVLAAIGLLMIAISYLSKKGPKGLSAGSTAPLTQLAGVLLGIVALAGVALLLTKVDTEVLKKAGIILAALLGSVALMFIAIALGSKWAKTAPDMKALTHTMMSMITNVIVLAVAVAAAGYLSIKFEAEAKAGAIAMGAIVLAVVGMLFAVASASRMIKTANLEKVTKLLGKVRSTIFTIGLVVAGLALVTKGMPNLKPLVASAVSIGVLMGIMIGALFAITKMKISKANYDKLKWILLETIGVMVAIGATLAGLMYIQHYTGVGLAGTATAIGLLLGEVILMVFALSKIKFSTTAPRTMTALGLTIGGLVAVAGSLALLAAVGGNNITEATLAIGLIFAAVAVMLTWMSQLGQTTKGMDTLATAGALAIVSAGLLAVGGSIALVAANLKKDQSVWGMAGAITLSIMGLATALGVLANFTVGADLIATAGALSIVAAGATALAWGLSQFKDMPWENIAVGAAAVTLALAALAVIVGVFSGVVTGLISTGVGAVGLGVAVAILVVFGAIAAWLANELAGLADSFTKLVTEINAFQNPEALTQLSTFLTTLYGLKGEGESDGFLKSIGNGIEALFKSFGNKDQIDSVIKVLNALAGISDLTALGAVADDLPKLMEALAKDYGPISIKIEEDTINSLNAIANFADSVGGKDMSKAVTNVTSLVEAWNLMNTLDPITVDLNDQAGLLGEFYTAMQKLFKKSDIEAIIEKQNKNSKINLLAGATILLGDNAQWKTAAEAIATQLKNNASILAKAAEDALMAAGVAGGNAFVKALVSAVNGGGTGGGGEGAGGVAQAAFFGGGIAQVGETITASPTPTNTSTNLFSGVAGQAIDIAPALSSVGTWLGNTFGINLSNGAEGGIDLSGMIKQITTEGGGVVEWLQNLLKGAGISLEDAGLTGGGMSNVLGNVGDLTKGAGKVKEAAKSWETISRKSWDTDRALESQKKREDEYVEALEKRLEALKAGEKYLTGEKLTQNKAAQQAILKNIYAATLAEEMRKKEADKVAAAQEKARKDWRKAEAAGDKKRLAELESFVKAYEDLQMERARSEFMDERAMADQQAQLESFLDMNERLRKAAYDRGDQVAVDRLDEQAWLHEKAMEQIQEERTAERALQEQQWEEDIKSGKRMAKKYEEELAKARAELDFTGAQRKALEDQTAMSKFMLDAQTKDYQENLDAYMEYYNKRREFARTFGTQAQVEVLDQEAAYHQLAMNEIQRQNDEKLAAMEQQYRDEMLLVEKGELSLEQTKIAAGVQNAMRDIGYKEGGKALDYSAFADAATEATESIGDVVSSFVGGLDFEVGAVAGLAATLGIDLESMADSMSGMVKMIPQGLGMTIDTIQTLTKGSAMAVDAGIAVGNGFVDTFNDVLAADGYDGWTNALNTMISSAGGAASTIAGIVAPEFAGLIDSATSAFQMIPKVMTMGTAAREKVKRQIEMSTDIATSILNTGDKLIQGATKLGQDFGTAFTSAMEAMTLQGWNNVLSNMASLVTDSMSLFTDAFSGVAETMAMLPGTLGELGGIMGMFSPMLGAASSMFGSALSGMASIADAIIKKIYDTIKSFIDGLWARRKEIGKALQKTWNGVMKGIDWGTRMQDNRMWASTQETFNDIMSMFGWDLRMGIDGAFSNAADQAARSMRGRALDIAYSMVDGVVTGLKKKGTDIAGDDAWNNVRQGLFGEKGVIRIIAEELLKALLPDGIIEDIGLWLNSAFFSLLSNPPAENIDTLAKIAKWFIDMMLPSGALKDRLLGKDGEPGIIDQFADFFKYLISPEAWPKTTALWKTVLDKLFPKEWVDFPTWAGSVAGAIIGALIAAPWALLGDAGNIIFQELFKDGKINWGYIFSFNFVKDFWNALWTSIKNYVRALWDSAIDVIKAVFQADVMIDIGGLAGVDNRAGGVAMEMAGLTGGIAHAFNPFGDIGDAIQRVGQRAQGLNGGVVNYITNNNVTNVTYNQTNNSPKALDEAAIYRDSTSLLRSKYDVKPSKT